MDTVRLVGRGRAGLSLAGALSEAGWSVLGVLGRGDPLVEAARGTDVVVLAVPDRAVAEVSQAVAPVPGAVVMHLSGSLGLDALAPHRRRASMHPLVTMPDPRTGSARLRGAHFAVAGDGAARVIARSLGGEVLEVRDENRTLYHAGACVASNHVVALMGQVERMACRVGVPLEAFVSLARHALDDVSAMGPAGALTGPVSRADWDVVEAHRRAIDPLDLDAYDTLAELARRLSAKRDAVTCS